MACRAGRTAKNPYAEAKDRQRDDNAGHRPDGIIPTRVGRVEEERHAKHDEQCPAPQHPSFLRKKRHTSRYRVAPFSPGQKRCSVSADPRLYGSPVSHSFHVDRKLPSGDWVDYWSEETRRTVAFRAACSCGWTGDAITGDQESGRPDEASEDWAYERWDRLHCPEYERRHGLL